MSRRRRHADESCAFAQLGRLAERGPAALLVLVLCAALSWSATAWARTYTVCSLTITTADEIEEFRVHLDPERFDFVELTPADRAAFRMRPWFGKACQSGVRCDVVVISAEFAGSYFQDGGLNLPLQELEERSCSGECAGILQHPLEVFLFACNSLASKGVDQRTPEEYLQVLLGHGFDRAQAERVVAARYGELGSSFCETTRRAFAGVPLIYGFDSRAPSGQNVRPLVRAYLRAVGDYAAHLEAIERSRTAVIRPRNALIEQIFRRADFRQTNGVRPGEPAFRKRNVACALYDEKRGVAQRLELVREIMHGPDFLAFLPHIQIFLGRHPPSRLQGSARGAFAELASISSAREETLRLMNQQTESLLGLELARFAHQMSWIDFDTFHAMAYAGVRRLLGGRGVGFEAREVICAIAEQDDLSRAFTIDDVGPGAFSDANGIMVVDCLGLRGPQVLDGLAAALDDSDAVTRAWAVYALSRQPAHEPSHIGALARRLHDPDPSVRWLAGRTLRYLRPQDEDSIEAIRRAAPKFTIDWVAPSKSSRLED